MAQVWEATDTVLGRSVALKLLHPHLAGDPSFVDRFRDEARSAARLSHQSIVAIYDTASDAGIEAIVMELIEGMTLRRYLDEYGSLSLADAADLTTQIAAALDTAHASRIVHRDIKPGNIMLCPDRRVKVTDFGIAKALEDGDRTTQGTLLGTAKYLAPEQVQGTPVDTRADIYSLGVVLYEALTGSPPFSADSDSATALARLHTDPRPLRELMPSIPASVERVVMTALARERDHRYATAGELAAALASAVATPGDAAGPAVGTAAGDAETRAADAPEVDLTRTGDLPQVDPTLTAGPHTTPPATSAGPARHRRHPAAATMVVALIIAGCLALGVGLILATEAGRDFVGRIRDNVTGADDTATPAPDTSAETGASGPQQADQPQTDGSLTESDSDPPAPTTATEPDGATTIDIAQIADFDPLGDGTERPERTGRAIDGRANTMWTSERYSNRALGNLKDGVGLVLTLSGEHTLNNLAVSSPTQGWAAQVYLADTPAADMTGWGEAIDGRVDIDGNTTFDLRGVRAGAVLLWITDLGNAPPRLRIEIAELELT